MSTANNHQYSLRPRTAKHGTAPINTPTTKPFQPQPADLRDEYLGKLAPTEDALAGVTLRRK